MGQADRAHLRRNIDKGGFRARWKKPDPIREVHGDGPQPSSLLLIGEGPGYWENKLGSPFHQRGPSGSVLNTSLAKAHIYRERTRVCNVVLTRTDDNDRDPTMAEIERDYPYLQSEVWDTQPKFIGTLGKVAAMAVLANSDHDMGDDPSTFAMDELHGRSTWIRNVCGTGLNATLCFMYHPAAGLHNTNLAASVFEDAKYLGRLMRGEEELSDWKDHYPNPDYQASDPSRLREELDFCHRISIDTEGWRGEPWCLTWSNRPGWGRLIRANDHVSLAILRKFLAETPDVLIIFHFALHDLEVLADMGIYPRPGTYTDTMELAFLRGGLEPQGLKPLARRHENIRMLDFDEVTTPHYRAAALRWMEKVLRHPGGWPASDKILVFNKKTGQYDIKKPQAIGTRIRNIYRDIRAEKRGKTGKLSDPQERWKGIDPQLQAPIIEHYGPMPKASVEYMPFHEVLSYACRDSDATWRIEPKLNALIEAEGSAEIRDIDLAILPMIERMQTVGMKASRKRFKELALYCDEKMEEIHAKLGREMGFFFNPNSPPDVARVLYQELKLPVDRLTKIKKVPSTDDKALEALRSKHRVVGWICDYREMSKVKDGFAIQLEEAMDEFDRVHTTFKYTRAASGRLTSTDPNLQGIPVRNEEGRKVRQCFEADSGHILMAADLDQVEMRVMAWLSGDEKLIGLFLSGKDIHSQTASDLFGMPLGQVDEFKHRLPAKRCAFGIMTGITGAGLNAQLKMMGLDIYSDKDCDQIILDWFGLYRGVRSFVSDCHSRARRVGYSVTRYGRRRYLPNIYSTTPWMREEAERQTQSHEISGTACDLMKRAMARLWQWRLDRIAAGKTDYAEFLLQIHDEVVAEVDDKPELRAEVEKVVVDSLCADSHLSPVPFKSKVKWANDWGKLK